MAVVIRSGIFRRGIAGPNRQIPPLSHLELYLLSSDLAGAVGSPVSLWPDRSGNGRDATQVTATKRPTLATSPNGKTTVHFAKGNTSPPGNWMSGGGVATMSQARGFTVYAYALFSAFSPSGFQLHTIVSGPNTFGLSAARQWLVYSFENDLNAALKLRNGYQDSGAVVDPPGTTQGGRHGYALGNYPSRTTIACVLMPPNSRDDPPLAPAGGPGYFFVGGKLTPENTTPACWRGLIDNNSSSDVYGLNNLTSSTDDHIGEMELGAVLWYSTAHDPTTVAAVSEYLRRHFEQ